MSLDKAIAKEMKRLAKDVLKLDKAIRLAASNAAAEGAVRTIANLAWATPVDKSTALSNWRATVGFPATRPIDAYFRGKDGSTQVQSIEATIQRAVDSLSRKKPSQEIFITNNVPYMELLANGGWSDQQEDPGWIEAVGNISEREWLMKWPIM